MPTVLNGSSCSLWVAVRDMTSGSTYSALLVVTVGGLNTLPGLVVGPWGGVLGDRVDRRVLMMVLQTFMASIAFAFALLVLSGHVQVWHAYAYVLVTGFLTPFRTHSNHFDSQHGPKGGAWQRLRYQRGDDHRLPLDRAILRRHIIAGWFAWNFTIEGLLYLGLVLALLPMKTPYYERRTATRRESPLDSLKEGVRYIWSGRAGHF